MGIFCFFERFKKKEKKLLEKGLNKNVVEGFLDKIEDIVCIADNNYKIEYINNNKLANKYEYLLELLEYSNNKEIYNEIIDITKEKGFYTNDIQIIKNNEQVDMYIAVYYIDTMNKYIIYIKDTHKYFKNENMLKEKLSKSNEELRNKDLFVANLSHEIKTPINIIIAMIYFLKSTKLDQTQNEYMVKLEEAADLLIELVNNILNVSKSDKVKNAINSKEKFILQKSIDKVYTMFKEELENKNIQWEIKSNFDLNIEVYEDKTKIEQIFINLVSNAVKYTDKGYIELDASKMDENVESYYIRFCIKDTGIGIKKEDTIKIFKEFEQTTDPTIKERDGFGLGLPLVKKIIESMGGKIWVESSYGLGTKIFFELRLQKNIDSIIEQGMLKSKDDKEDTFNPVCLNKVLLVDDNKTINQITAKILKELNIECDIAEDGMEAIKKVEQNGKSYYSIILMDIHMPKYNGYDISRIMKKDLQVATPIVALTATNITDTVIEENKEYIHSYIQKPIKPESLKETVKDILDKNSNLNSQNKEKQTVLLIADEKQNQEIIDGIKNNFDVICTLNHTDISIIVETKELAAIIIDKNNKEFNEINFEKQTVLFLNYDICENKHENITLIETDGYMKQVKDVETIGLVLLDIINKHTKEQNIEHTIKEYNNEISDIYNFLYESLVNLTSVRSKETGSHLMRTQEYMKMMLNEYERIFSSRQFKEQKTIEDIGVAATLHDIGKVGISDEILNKPGKLTDEEYNKIKDHVIIGHQILENTYSDKISNEVLEYAKEITLHHHEKYDGTGYPHGLKEEEINIVSRIMAIIDVYDALVNDRVYRKAMSYEEAEEYIASQSGKAFDPKVVNVFLRIKDKLREVNEKYKE